jgi:hypothetical protein
LALSALLGRVLASSLVGIDTVDALTYSSVLAATIAGVLCAAGLACHRILDLSVVESLKRG